MLNVTSPTSDNTTLERLSSLVDPFFLEIEFRLHPPFWFSSIFLARPHPLTRTPSHLGQSLSRPRPSEKEVLFLLTQFHPPGQATICLLGSAALARPLPLGYTSSSWAALATLIPPGWTHRHTDNPHFWIAPLTASWWLRKGFQVIPSGSCFPSAYGSP